MTTDRFRVELKRGEGERKVDDVDEDGGEPNPEGERNTLLYWYISLAYT